MDKRFLIASAMSSQLKLTCLDLSGEQLILLQHIIFGLRDEFNLHLLSFHSYLLIALRCINRYFRHSHWSTRDAALPQKIHLSPVAAIAVAPWQYTSNFVFESHLERL